MKAAIRWRTRLTAQLPRVISVAVDEVRRSVATERIYGLPVVAAEARATFTERCERESLVGQQIPALTKN